MASTSGYQDEDVGGGIISDINVTPLVDITLVLLIIFMVTARLIVKRGIQVESPKTVAGAPGPSPLELTLLPGGELYMNGQRVRDPEVVSRRVRESLKSDPELRPIITADKSVPHGEVMAIVDLVKVAGVKRFAMTTEVKTGE